MTKASKSKEEVLSEVQPICGVVMPISKTSHHDAKHWSDILELTHRAIEKSGHEPKNVWVGTSSDRITARILSNLLSASVVVCDITDLNANVMVELGIRLSSRKPTVVIAEAGTAIPFDIKDFEAVLYPQHLRMPEMEAFLSELTSTIVEKAKAFADGRYEAFIADVADFEVLELNAREVPFENLVAGRLDLIMGRLERLDSNRSTPVQADRRKHSAISYFRIPEEHAASAISLLEQSDRTLDFAIYGALDGMTAFGIYHSASTNSSVNTLIDDIVSRFDGERGVPDSMKSVRSAVDKWNVDFG